MLSIFLVFNTSNQEALGGCIKPKRTPALLGDKKCGQINNITCNIVLKCELALKQEPRFRVIQEHTKLRR